MAVPNVITMKTLYQGYVDAGFALCVINEGKGPKAMGWNEPHHAIYDASLIPEGAGVGLLHAYSTPTTCALDIDNFEHASIMLSSEGVNMVDLMNAPDAVGIRSGNPGHGKLLYRLPATRSPMASKQVKVGGKVAFELRCATANGLSVQDVLPSAVRHPTSGLHYEWVGAGDWRGLPTLPEALLAAWDRLLAKDSVRTISTGAPLDANWSEVQSALETLDPDMGREDWLHCGMAIHWAGTQTDRLDEALQLWDSWSSRGTKYKGQRDIMYCWQSFKSDKDSMVRLGTLFKLAKDAGWQRPAVDITGLFKPTPDAPEAPLEDAPPLLSDPRRGDIVVPLDLSLVPPLLAQRAREIADSVGCDPAVPLWAGLGAICGAMDSRSTLKVDEKFTVRPILWLMTIGAPSDKKTPGSDPMILPLKEIEAEDSDRAKRELRIWEAKEAIAIAAKKRYHAAKSTPEALLETAAGLDAWDDMPPELDLPPRPHQLRITTTDITSQALARICAAHPRGILCHLDEMSSWMRKMADPKSGESRSTWVQAYAGGLHKLDRVVDGAIRVENMAVSIVGNVQPRVFQAEAKQLMSDGLLQRFLYVKLDGTKTSVGKGIPEWLTSEGKWSDLLRLLCAMPAAQYVLSPGATTAFDQFRQYVDDVRKREKLLQSSDAYQESIGKLVGSCARMALVWHAIESPWNPEVSEGLMVRVIEFMRSTVMLTLRHVLDVSLAEGTFDAWLRDHILAWSDQATITMPEIKRSGLQRLNTLGRWDTETQIMDAMSDLERVKWVARMDDGSRGSTVTWAINPALAIQFAEHRDAVIRARQERQREIYRDNPKKGSRVGKDVHGFDPERHGKPLGY